VKVLAEWGALLVAKSSVAANQVISAEKATFLVTGRAKEWLASVRALEGGLIVTEDRRAGQVPGALREPDFHNETPIIVPPQVAVGSRLFLACREVA
jgi:hypothetical protein